jgi:hypothetical protein
METRDCSVACVTPEQESPKVAALTLTGKDTDPAKGLVSQQLAGNDRN